MRFEPNVIYHVMNRGNNKQTIFFSDRNYHFFLQKIKKEIIPLADVISYCLMPNHYHLLLMAKESGCEWINPISSNGSLKQQKLSRKIGTLQSSYTRAINKERNRSGSLFQSRALIKDGWEEGLFDVNRTVRTKVEANSFFGFNTHNDYALVCFNYIHENPVKAGLVIKSEDWPYSSAYEYARSIPDICTQKIAKDLFSFI